LCNKEAQPPRLSGRRGERRGEHKISIQHMLHNIMNEQEQVNCVKNRDDGKREDKKHNRANPRQIVTQNPLNSDTTSIN
jgi:hypothetical protein